MGSRSTTRLLSRIALEEPVPASELIDRNLSESSTYRALRHAERYGLIVSSSQIPGRPKSNTKKHLRLNHSLQFSLEFLEILSVISSCTGAYPRSSIMIDFSKSIQIPDEIHVDLDLLFGSRTRTMAVMLVALAKFLDSTTIARFVGIAPTGEMLSLLTPLVKGRVLQKRACGKFALYALADELWRVPLRNLCLRIAEISPRLTTLARLAEQSRDSGDSPPRKNLRKHKSSLLQDFE